MRCSFVTPRCRVAEKLYVASNYVVTPGSESCPLELFLLGHSRGYMYTSPELIFSGKVCNRRLEEGLGRLPGPGLSYPSICSFLQLLYWVYGAHSKTRQSTKKPKERKTGLHQNEKHTNLAGDTPGSQRGFLKVRLGGTDPVIYPTMGSTMVQLVAMEDHVCALP